MTRVTHLIVGLGKGGAETMLYQLIKYKRNPELEYRVISLGASHYYENMIRDCGVEVIEYNIKKHPLKTFIGVCKILKTTDTLCCWMYHANFIGYIASCIVPVKKLVWCIRHSNLEKEYNKRSTLLINKYCAKKSNKVDVITYNGERARAIHETFGYSNINAKILVNGCDMSIYHHIDGADKLIRDELKISHNKKIILSVAKDHPIKDLPTFIKAFGLVRQNNDDCVAIMCGQGVDENNIRLKKLCDESKLQIGKDIFLLGMRHDIPVIMSASDVYVLHSAGEAFPNTLLQAMACGCICIATDVGDVKLILKDNERIVCPKQPNEIAQKVSYFLSKETVDICGLQEQQIEIVSNIFSIEVIISEYENLMFMNRIE